MNKKNKLELNNMPFHIIERADFEGLTLLITFVSGQQLKATSPNQEEYNIMKEVFLDKLGIDKVFIK